MCLGGKLKPCYSDKWLVSYTGGFMVRLLKSNAFKVILSWIFIFTTFSCSSSSKFLQQNNNNNPQVYGDNNQNQNENNENNDVTAKEYRTAPSMEELNLSAQTLAACSTIFMTFFSSLQTVSNDLMEIRALCELSGEVFDPEELSAIQAGINSMKSDIVSILSTTEAGQNPIIVSLFTGVDLSYYINSTPYTCVDGQATDLSSLNTRINLDAFSISTEQDRTQCIDEVDSIFADIGENSLTAVMNYDLPDVPVDMASFTTMWSTRSTFTQIYGALGQTDIYNGHDISDFFCEEIRTTVPWAVSGVLSATASMLEVAQDATDPELSEESRAGFNLQFQQQYRIMEVLINELSTINHHSIVAGESYYKNSCLRGLVFDVTAEGLNIAGHNLTSVENAQAAVAAFSGLNSKLSKMYIVATSLSFIDMSQPGRFDKVPLSELNITLDGDYSMFPEFTAPSIDGVPIEETFDHIIIIPNSVSKIGITIATFEDGATVTVKKNSTTISPQAPNSFNVTDVVNGDVIYITATATDGSASSIYTLTVSKGDARLNTLSVDDQSFTPVFSPATTLYCLELDASQDITVNATTIDGIISGSGLITANNGVEIPITVTDGALVRSYKIIPYIRGQELPADCREIISNNGYEYSLSNIVVQGSEEIPLSPAFYYGTDSYSVNVPLEVDDITITLSTITTNDVIITLYRNGEQVSEGSSKVLNIQGVVDGDQICVSALSLDRSQGGAGYCITVSK